MTSNDEARRTKAPRPTYRKAARGGEEGREAPKDAAPGKEAAQHASGDEAKAAASAKVAEGSEGAKVADGGTGGRPRTGARKGAHARPQGVSAAPEGRMVPAGSAAGKPVDAPSEKAGASLKPRRVAALAAAVVIAAVVVGAGLLGAFGSPEAGSGIVVDGTALEVDDIASDGKLANPIDWEAWTARNGNVYAWLAIAGTEVDQPVLQHPLIDDYYLTHNIDGEPLIDGALYTQLSYNSKDPTADKVTVIYGHTFEDNDKMFSTLHNFEDATFFEEHPTFYLYTPTQRLEYEVVSAFDSDNKHILETRDMDDPAVVEELFSMVQAPTTMNGNVRALAEPLDPATDKLLVLSTCTKPANDNARYLVVAVLRDVQPTEDRQVELVDPNLQIETLSEPME